MTEQEIDKLQEFIESNLHSDVSDEIYNKIMSDAETLEMDQFNKTWDSYLRDHSVGWKKERVNTDPLSKQVADAFNDNLNPSDNWIYENFPGVDPELIKAELEKLRTEKAKKDNEKKKGDEQKAKETERYARQKAVDDYRHSYLGMDLDNPINKGLNWLADMIISDDTKRAIIEDPENTAAILANAGVDIGGTALDFAPGYGALLGTGARVSRDIAQGRDFGDVVSRNWVDAALGAGGAKLSKSFKVKGVKDDAEAATQALAGQTGNVGEAVQNIKKLENIGKGDLLYWVPHPDEVKYIASKDFTPRDWAKYVAQFEDTMPETYEFLKGIKYEDRGKLLSKLKEATENVKSFAQNEGERALAVRRKHPIKYKAVEYGTPVMKQGAVGLSKTTSRAGKQDTPYKTSDPNKATFKREQDVIDWYKENYGDQWRAGFKPRPINGELMMKAWQEGHDSGQW